MAARRSDAQRNRLLILEQARAALAVSGEASMQSIAKLAGVGQGTLYRHFPTREALVLEVHRRDVRALVDDAPRLLDSHEPLVALRRWLELLASYGRIKHGLAGALHQATHEQLAGEGYADVVGAIALLLAAGQQDGAIRSDVDAEELLLLLGFLWRIDNADEWDTRSSHLLDLVMDALRTQGPQPQ